MFVLLALQLMAQGVPSQEAISLGRKLAEQSAIVDTLIAMQAEELTELAAEPEALALTEHQREALNAVGQRIAARTRDLVITGLATTYAKNLSTGDLKALVAAGNRPEALRLRALWSRATTMAALMIGPVSLKRQTAAQYCAEMKLMCVRSTVD